jgi:hypothetical protein
MEAVAMSAEIQTLPDGTEALVITTGTNIEVIGLDVLGSYSELLGEPDPAKTVLLIRGAMKIKDQTGMWEPLYENLHAGLGELVNAGVPPEFMPDLMEEATGSPVPGKAAGMRAAQKAVRDRVKSGSQNTSEFAALLRTRRDRLKGARSAFLESIAPRRAEPAPVTAARSPFIREAGQASDDRRLGSR